MRVDSGWVPALKNNNNKKKITPETRPEPTGFGDFQPEPAKKDTKSARCGPVRVGRIGQVLPTPSGHKGKTDFRFSFGS
jgi:hypothetical protein